MKKLTHLSLFSTAKLLSASVVLGTVCVTGLDVAIRRSTGSLIDAISSGALQTFGWAMPVCMVLLFIPLKFLIPYLKTRLSGHLQESLYTRLQNRAMLADQSALDGVDPGTASTYFTSDVSGILRYADRIVSRGVPDAFTFLFSAGVLISMQPWLGLAAILSCVFPVMCMTFTSKALVQRSARYQGVLQRINQKMATFLFNLEFIKANGMEQALESENEGLLGELLQEKRDMAKRESLLSASMTFSAFLTILVLSILGGYFVLRGSMRIGELFTAIALSDHIVSPAMGFQNTIAQVRRSEANFNRINAFLTLPDEGEEAAHVRLGDFSAPLSLELTGLRFAYPNGKAVFSDMNCRWEQGKLHAIAGENGAGKSTLMKLLCGVYELQGGTVAITGVSPARPLKKQALRDLISIDTQRTVLFADTVRANLTLGRDVAQADLERACRAAGIEDELRALPGGYDTILGPDGSPLSGGQKRRLCLARALLLSAPIMIFDEPTVGVDPEHIRAIVAELRELSARKLILVITHEPLLIGAADTVTRLEALA